jgi:hypothetical protein
MNEFISDLERELVAAARRRATGRRRIGFVPRVRPATVLAILALAALTFAAVAVVRGLEDGSRTGDERPEVPPPPGATFPLPAAPVAQPCPGVEQREYSGGLQHPFSVFTRPRTGADALPALAGADSFSWIPAGTIFPTDARRAAPEQFDAEVYLVPAAEPRQGGTCDGRREAVLAVCLVVVDDETVVRCFEEDELEGGRAVAVTSAGVAYGVVPDPVERVTLDAPGENVSATVHDNAFEMPIAAKAGDQVRLELARIRQCRPSDELLDAVPALRDAGWVKLPSAAEDALPSGGMPRWARRIETDGELVLWVLAHCDAAERACVIGVLDGNWVAQPCATARELRQRGLRWTFPAGNRVGVAGIAPPGTRSAEAVRGDRSQELALTGGVYGTVLPAAFGSADPARDGAIVDVVVRFRSR